MQPPFQKKNFIGTGNKAHELGFNKAIELSNEWKVLAEEAKANAILAEKGLINGNVSLSSAADFASKLGAAITIAQILDTALSAE